MTFTEFAEALKNTDEVEITVTGRTSGRKISTPVWFVSEAETLYLLPVKGSDSAWFKNILKTPTMRLSADGKEWTAEVKPVTDKAAVQSIVEKFRKKYGADQVKKYYSKFDVAVDVSYAGNQRRSA
ncbi:MAG TPA: nitroreductase/quinone reductase family protein [Terriglobia bacterium]|jgi:deazaflavin-dependent oxidoreductase (nitroreductase family)|nr:nitroreductase/quinone reductase family protein [Terriglobia bacterium]